MHIEFEHCICDLCGGNDYHVRYRKPDTWLWLNQFEYPVVECNNCGLVYVNPRPTQESMKFFYASDYHEDRNTEIFLSRYEIESSFLPKLTEEKILDIGCARGDFLLFLKKKYQHISLFGTDLFSDHVKSSDINFSNCLLYDGNYPNDFFDIITSWAVFEHLHTPTLYFREVNRILKKGGRFVFLITNSESLYGKRAFTEDVPRHLYHYSEKTLNSYAKKFGFFVNKISYDDRVWDGRGINTFYYMFSNFFGVDWETIYFKKANMIQRISGKIGSFLDSIIFKTHWEAKNKCSGVIIVEFIKK